MLIEENSVDFLDYMRWDKVWHDLIGSIASTAGLDIDWLWRLSTFVQKHDNSDK